MQQAGGDARGKGGTGDGNDGYSRPQGVARSGVSIARQGIERQVGERIPRPVVPDPTREPE